MSFLKKKVFHSELVYKNNIPISNNCFSILTACHNKKIFLEDLISSILKQNYRPLEMVFIDDESQDGSLNYLLSNSHRFIEKKISLLVFKNKPRGYCSSSYRIVTKKARGIFFGVVDSDDMLVDDAVEYVVKLYHSHPDISYIWTQFDICDNEMAFKKRGISRAPDPDKSMVDMGIKHTFSHWRTFSSRLDKDQVFCDGYVQAVDKYMGYRLEELGKGMFVDRVCYRYREGVKSCITSSGKGKLIWNYALSKAIQRRSKHNLKPYPVIVFEGTKT